jgi:hypothetical protein
MQRSCDTDFSDWIAGSVIQHSALSTQRSSFSRIRLSVDADHELLSESLG